MKSELAPRYAEFIGHEIQKAYLESYTEYGQNLFDRYIAYADAWIEEQDFKDPDTGQIFDREMLDAELSKIEKPAGIANPKDFRNEVVKFALRARANNDGKNPAWTSYEKLREVIEKRMFSQVEDLLPVISFGTKKDSTTDKQHQEFVSAWSSAATPSARCAVWSSGTCGSTRPADRSSSATTTRQHAHFIDRRLNPKQKSLGNRQRFMRRARAQIKEGRQQVGQGPQHHRRRRRRAISIPTKGIGEPRFHHARSGGKPSGSSPATRSSSPATRSPSRAAAAKAAASGHRQRRGRGRVPVRPVARRVPRPVLRGPGAARPGQDQPQGGLRLQAAAGRLRRPGLADQHQPVRAPCATASAGASRCGARRPATRSRVREEIESARAPAAA